MRHGITEHVIKSKKPLFLHGDNKEMLVELNIRYSRYPAASWLGVPMMMGSHVLGVIAVQDYDDPNAFTDEHVVYLQSIANEAAIAVVNAQLYKELEYEKKYFESLVMNFPIAVIAVNYDYNITIFNPSAEKLFGYSRQEAIGSNIDDIVGDASSMDEVIELTKEIDENGRVHINYEKKQ